MSDKRLNKAISETGFCSRREADRLIESGSVFVNGSPAILGLRVISADRIEVDGKLITKEVENIYLAFNKPVGITCTTDRSISGNIADFIGYHERIFPIGRLDKPSSGLIFMTNDGDIVNKILRSKNNHEKEYLVKVNKKITRSFIDEMSKGVPVLDTITEPCSIEMIDDLTFKITLTQGLNRQIRRMCQFFEYEVVNLKRTRIMNINLEGIRVGKYRRFTDTELKVMNELIADSSKTEEAS